MAILLSANALRAAPRGSTELPRVCVRNRGDAYRLPEMLTGNAYDAVVVLFCRQGDYRPKDSFTFGTESRSSQPKNCRTFSTCLPSRTTFTDLVYGLRPTWP